MRGATLEKVLGAGFTLGGLAYWATGPEPIEVSLGTLLCGFSGILLGQGLIRDVAVILTRRQARQRGEPVPRARAGSGPQINLCMESTLGVTLLSLGFLYTAFPEPPVFPISGGLLLAGTGVTLILGWLIRDWVLTIRHVEDHYDLPVVQGADTRLPTGDEAGSTA